MTETRWTVAIGLGMVLMMGAMMVGMMGDGWVWGVGALMMLACLAIPAVGFGWHWLRRSRDPSGPRQRVSGGCRRYAGG